MSKANNEMLPDYDLSGKKGVRNKYQKYLKNGYTIRVYDKKKLVDEKLYAAIDPDVREYFPDSKSVNKALRKIISLVPDKRSAA